MGGAGCSIWLGIGCLFKRPAGIKDSGNLIPGHGGAFDRLDAWLWAAVIGYYYIQWFLI